MRINSAAVVLVSLFALVSAVPVVYAADGELVMGVFPRQNAKETTSIYQPIADYLSKKIGKSVRFVTSKDFDSFWQAITERQFDIAHLNQYQYVKAHKEHGYDVIIRNVEFGEDKTTGSIYVRKDSGITKIEQLRGKKIIFGGGPQAFMSYQMPLSLLRKAGLQKGDYVEEIAKNPPNAILATYFKQADAGCAGSIGIKLPAVTSKINPDELTMLAESEPVYFIPWAVKKEMEPAVKSAIQEGMAGMSDDETGKKLLAAAEVTRFAKAVETDFDPHRLIVKEVLGENY